MKILRLTGMALAGAMGWGILCGGFCDGTNINDNPTIQATTCPAGTVLQAGQCAKTHSIKSN